MKGLRRGVPYAWYTVGSWSVCSGGRGREACIHTPPFTEPLWWGLACSGHGSGSPSMEVVDKGLCGHMYRGPQVDSFSRCWGGWRR